MSGEQLSKDEIQVIAKYLQDWEIKQFVAQVQYPPHLPQELVLLRKLLYAYKWLLACEKRPIAVPDINLVDSELLYGLGTILTNTDRRKYRYRRIGTKSYGWVLEEEYL